MVQISGKYKLVDSKNFYELLLEFGVPQEKAKEDDEIKGTVEIKIDGKNITLQDDTPPKVTNFVVGEERDETFGDDVYKSTAALSGNIITITSKTKNGEPAGSRTLTFSDSGLEIAISAPKDGKTLSATRIYKRI